MFLISIILDAPHGAKFMSAYVKDFFLVNSMKKSKLIKIDIRNFHLQYYFKISTHHSTSLTYEYIYTKIYKGMYKLHQRAIITVHQPHQWIANNDSSTLFHDCIHCWISATDSLCQRLEFEEV